MDEERTAWEAVKSGDLSMRDYVAEWGHPGQYDGQPHHLHSWETPEARTRLAARAKR